jgi:hypothetical protein
MHPEYAHVVHPHAGRCCRGGGYKCEAACAADFDDMYACLHSDCGVEDCVASLGALPVATAVPMTAPTATPRPSLSLCYLSLGLRPESCARVTTWQTGWSTAHGSGRADAAENAESRASRLVARSSQQPGLPVAGVLYRSAECPAATAWYL